MLTETIGLIKCTENHPGICKLKPIIEVSKETPKGLDMIRGMLECDVCSKRYPIVKGVLILTNNLYDYFNDYILGIRRFAGLEDIPQHFKKHYLLALENKRYNCHIRNERWEVNSWYLINSFFSKKEVLRFLYKNNTTEKSCMERLIGDLWDKGPLFELASHLNSENKYDSCIDLGCNVGGSIYILHKHCNKSIGVDISFSAIATARSLFYEPENFSHKFLGEPLFEGENFRINLDIDTTKFVDFFVSDLRNFPLEKGRFDFALCLNVIDMVNDPIAIIELCKNLLKENGTTFYSCPYTWSEAASASLRRSIPSFIESSSEAIEWIFNNNNFSLEDIKYDLPWLFLKHKRQAVIYSLHSFFAKKNTCSF